MTVIQKLVDTVIDTGKKLKREDSIQSSTKAMFDARWGFGGGEKTLTDGNAVQSLVVSPSNTATASGTGSITYTGVAGSPKTQGGGWKFTKGVGKNRFNLSADAVPKFTNTKWLLQTYLKLDEYAQTGSNNCLMNVGSTAIASSSSNIGIQVTSSDGFIVTALNIFARGTTFNLTTSTTNSATIFEKLRASSGRKVLLGISCEVGETSTAVGLYLDGVLLYSSTRTNATSEIINSTMTWNATASYPAHIAGTFYRYRFDDLTVSASKTAQELSTIENEACIASFSN